MTKQVEKSLDVEGKQGHRNNLAKMIEDLEFKMRSDWGMFLPSRSPNIFILRLVLTISKIVEGVNFANTQKVVSGLRSKPSSNNACHPSRKTDTCFL